MQPFRSTHTRTLRPLLNSARTRTCTHFYSRPISTTAVRTSFATDMQTLKNTIAENVGLPGAHSLALPEHQFKLDDTPDLTGKVAIVTGGSEGIGLASSYTLLKHGISRLYILSPTEDRAKAALQMFEKDLGASKAGRATWVPCDLSDWSATKATAELLSSQIDRLDILLNVAGRGIMTDQRNNVDIDLHMATNHFGHVVLTSVLLPLLKKTAEAGNTVRITNAGSNLHQQAPSDVKFADIAELNKDLGPNGEYGRSKLAAILYSRYLARHLSPSHPFVLANAFHPGVVDTRQSNEHIHEPFPITGWANNALYPLKKDIWDAAVSVVYCATKTDKTGEYVCPPAIPEPGSEMSRDEALGEQLMKLTAEVLKAKSQIELKFY